MRGWLTSGEIDTVLFDIDALIWIQGGTHRPAALVEKEQEGCISVLTYMQLPNLYLFIKGCEFPSLGLPSLLLFA